MIGELAASGMFAGGVIWPHYPLTRMVNFERIRLSIHATATLQLMGGNVGLGGSDSHGKEITSYASDDPGDFPDHTVRNRYGYGKSFFKRYSDSSVTGSCSATLDRSDIPCWHNGYFLFFAGGGMPATSFSGSATAVAATVEDSHDYYRSYEYYEDQETGVSGWRLLGYSGNVNVDSTVIEELERKEVSASATSCTAAVRMFTSLGHGREVNLCPVVMQGGGNRPREAVVFAGSLGVSFEWKFHGTGKYREWKYRSHSVKKYEWGENGTGHWYDVEQPADAPEEDTTLDFSYSAGSDWDSGLQVWKLPGETGGNVIRGEHNGVTKRYSQAGGYEVIHDEGTLDETSSSHSGSGSCSLAGGVGTARRSVSGRSAAGGSDSPLKYPLTHYSGHAECTTIFDDGAPVFRSCDGAGAADAYESYLDAVKNCDENEPAIADYPGAGHTVQTSWSGTYSRDHRIENMVLELTLQEV